LVGPTSGEWDGNSLWTSTRLRPPGSPQAPGRRSRHRRSGGFVVSALGRRRPARRKNQAVLVRVMREARVVLMASATRTFRARSTCSVCSPPPPSSRASAGACPVGDRPRWSTRGSARRRSRNDEGRMGAGRKAVAGLRGTVRGGGASSGVRTCAELGWPRSCRAARAPGRPARQRGQRLASSSTCHGVNQVLEIDPNNLVCVVQPGTGQQRQSGGSGEQRPVVPRTGSARSGDNDRTEKGPQSGGLSLHEVLAVTRDSCSACAGVGREGR